MERVAPGGGKGDGPSEDGPSLGRVMRCGRCAGQFSSVMPSIRREKDGAEMYSDSW